MVSKTIGALRLGSSNLPLGVFSGVVLFFRRKAIITSPDNAWI
jgi:hypothetical protein